MEAEILRVAADIFSERGYRTTTLNDLAAAAGISRATFYYYFPSKEELLRRMYHEVISSTRAALERIVAEELPVQEKLRHIIRHQVSHLAAHKPLVQVFFSEVFNLSPELSRSVMQASRTFSQMIEGVVEEGVRESVLIPLDPKRFTYALIGMCNWMYRWYRPGGEWTPNAIADEFIRVLESGYLRRDAEPQSEALLREVHALRQLVEQLQTTILACTRPASGRRRRTSASSKKTRS
jgi:AcrR family transcriptional regulator